MVRTLSSNQKKRPSIERGSPSSPSNGPHKRFFQLLQILGVPSRSMVGPILGLVYTVIVWDVLGCQCHRTSETTGFFGGHVGMPQSGPSLNRILSHKWFTNALTHSLWPPSLLLWPSPQYQLNRLRFHHRALAFHVSFLPHVIMLRSPTTCCAHHTTRWALPALCFQARRGSEGPGARKRSGRKTTEMALEGASFY